MPLHQYVEGRHGVGELHLEISAFTMHNFFEMVTSVNIDSTVSTIMR